MMKGMPAIPESTCSSITLRLLDHTARHWPQIKNLHVRCSHGFAYVTAVLPGDNESRIWPVFRALEHFMGLITARDRRLGGRAVTGMNR
jgi:hypothetical protein